ncbi:hypothetical protein HanXRQr2_Chr01g0012811 [Helianthus annuus]|uniref:Uncharacterized protein n=1 Tax=Helianthus annuus TaxID=4232 RepID=A0A251VLT0_HELAN|nr:uncharacterized protein LOC110936419 isoform X2 [Helianthus annuus]KAF5821341.1 hypothetical protein HanXRQr2_Chr01g0012811 [Helianthus annuus]KAJ0621927.1 hypothetical protein HanIR_Chr01g0014291 [Helianthus annuus]KAJ0956247.1 hypothetical protein HanPSC8_Chr01g0012491 [Helianthus annuus]
MVHLRSRLGVVRLMLPFGSGYLSVQFWLRFGVGSKTVRYGSNYLFDVFESINRVSSGSGLVSVPSNLVNISQHSQGWSTSGSVLGSGQIGQIRVTSVFHPPNLLRSSTFGIIGRLSNLVD